MRIRSTETPTYSRAHIKKIQSLFDSAYNELEREKLMLRLNKSVERGLLDDFVEDYKKAVDDMEQQHGEIRVARKQLFDWDFPDIGPNIIDLEKDEHDGNISWDAENVTLSPSEMQVQEQWNSVEDTEENHDWNAPDDTLAVEGPGWDNVGKFEGEWMTCDWESR